MRGFTIAAFVAGFLPVAAHSATLTMDAKAEGVVQGVPFISTALTVSDPEFFGTPVASATRSTPNNEGIASATAEADYNAGTMKSQAAATRFSGTASSGHLGNSTATLTDDTYTASGAGTVTVSVRFEGSLSVLSDLQNKEQFAAVFGGYSINAPSLIESNGFDSSLLPDPLYSSSGGMFDFVLDSTFAVMDGDVFGLNVEIGSLAGTLDEGAAFFDAFASIKSTLTIKTDGTKLEPGGEVPPPNEVPLPASAFLLIGGLAALRVMRARV